MTVTSFYYFVFLIVGIAAYYLTPKKVQWVTLLVLSLVFYYFAATPYTILFLAFSTILAYISTMLMVSREGGQDKGKKIVVWITMAAIVANIVVWFVLKGSSFYILFGNLMQRLLPSFPKISGVSIAGALGMGYYTAQVIGYILDVYWGISKPQKNPLKLFLFVCFFPQLTVGPISKYRDLQTLYEGHAFQYENICLGAQRILFGVFKKLVISERVAVIVNGIWADAASTSGLWSWIAVLLYPLEIYTDFSGCMDIILGTAQLFDIKLAENFKNPFFSRSVQEFWQRWHITLGAWAKDYVYYPFLKSKPMLRLGKWSKKHFKKRIAKLIPWTVGMAVLWFVMGFWHGSTRHIVGVSAWFFTVLVLSELCSPLFKKITAMLKIRTESFSWKLFQCARTYCIYSLGCIPFSANRLKDALQRVKILILSLRHLNPWTLFDETILSYGVTWVDINLILFGILVLLIVGILREKYGYARTWIAEQGIVFRWIIWISFFGIILIYGFYGPGYSASQFIYQGF